VYGINNNPYRDANGNPTPEILETAKNRAKVVLMKMLQLGYITQEEHDAAVAEADAGLGFNHGDGALTTTEISYHTEAAISQVIDQIMQEKNMTKDMAEVFTPSWVCNAQNNLVDEAWFGRKDVFNIEDPQTKTWKSTPEPIQFPEGKTWKQYVRATRMEITCGEGPYLVSRYDTTTGDFIPLEERIGLLDRKLRVVSENTETSGEWLEMAQEAFKNIYAFEWQGDNLLLAREALLMSFIEYYQAKFGKEPQLKSILYIAYVISWNVWQMDGLKGVVPDSCKNGVKVVEQTLFGETENTIYCKGCKEETYIGHNGIYCLIRDWGLKDPKTGENNRKIRFIDLIKK
jgi:hypothetical protein